MPQCLLITFWSYLKRIRVLVFFLALYRYGRQLTQCCYIRLIYKKHTSVYIRFLRFLRMEPKVFLYFNLHFIGGQLVLHLILQTFAFQYFKFCKTFLFIISQYYVLWHFHPAYYSSRCPFIFLINPIFCSTPPPFIAFCEPSNVNHLPFPSNCLPFIKIGSTSAILRVSLTTLTYAFHLPFIF